MEIRYKLVDRNYKTRNETDWSGDDWKETSGKGDLCGSGWLHCYTDPLLAVMLNPIHENIKDPRMIEVEVDGKCKSYYGLHEGWTRMRRHREIPVPVVTINQLIRFGILCVKQVCRYKAWNRWADGWLSGTDRSVAASSKWASENVAAARAVKAASSKWSLTNVAAARAVKAAEGADAKAAAGAAAASKWASAKANVNIDLAALAHQAVKEEGGA